MPKYAPLEDLMIPWLDEQSKEKVILTDAMIRDKALEVALVKGPDYGKFKASPGWVENFKARMGIRKGVWHGNGKKRDIDAAFAFGGGAESPRSPGARPKRVDIYPSPPPFVGPLQFAGMYNRTPPGYNKRAMNGGSPDDDQDDMAGMDEVDEVDGVDEVDENAGGMDSMATMLPAVGGTHSTYQSLPAADYQTQHETGWQPVAAPAPVYVQPATQHDGHTGSLGLVDTNDPTPTAVGHSHANYAEPVHQEQYVLENQPAHSDNAHVEPLEGLSHLPFPPFPEDELPDYLKCINTIAKLCGKDDFKAFASLKQYDYSVLDNLVKAVHAYTTGQPYVRIS